MLTTVNEAIDNLDILDGQYIYLEGFLTFEFEDISVDHYPKVERRDHFYTSIEIEVGYGVFSFNERLLSRWSGKRVVVGGTLHKLDPNFMSVRSALQRV